MICFRKRAWEDYVYWQQTDKIILKRINMLIKDIQRNPFSGLGKPEPLKHQFTGLWSRRINDEHRLVYTLMNSDGVMNRLEKLVCPLDLPVATPLTERS